MVTVEDYFAAVDLERYLDLERQLLPGAPERR